MICEKKENPTGLIFISGFSNGVYSSELVIAYEGDGHVIDKLALIELNISVHVPTFFFWATYVYKINKSALQQLA